MDSNKVKILLEKYWDGESSLEEETQLRAYFQGNQIEDELKPYQPLFQFFHVEHEKHLTTDFDEKLIQNLQRTEREAPRVRSLPYYLVRIAAVGLLLIAAYFVVENNFSEPVKDRVAMTEEMSPEEAYAQTKAALLLVSAKLNKGTDMANKGLKQVNKATGVIK